MIDNKHDMLLISDMEPCKTLQKSNKNQLVFIDKTVDLKLLLSDKNKIVIKLGLVPFAGISPF